ncbi:hypothetical protein BD309DRAFT_995653 [Dichomitus squalens]|nr:hypothetical protein BD309DRAFT_995653 [Dichomitus squalens]
MSLSFARKLARFITEKPCKTPEWGLVLSQLNRKPKIDVHRGPMCAHLGTASGLQESTLRPMAGASPKGARPESEVNERLQSNGLLDNPALNRS